MTNRLDVDGDRPAVVLVAALPASWTNEADRLVLTMLACDSFDGDIAMPGYDNLASWTGLHRGTVYEVVRRLCAPTRQRPALLAIDDTRRGGRRTRFRLLLPTGEPEQPSGDAGLSEPSGDAGRSTVAQPSSYRPVSLDGEPSSYRPVTLETPPLPSNTPSSPAPTCREDADARAHEEEEGSSRQKAGPGGSLASWVASEDGISLDDAHAVVALARDDKSTRFSSDARLQKSPDYRRQLLRLHRTTRAAEDARAGTCEHGRANGRAVKGRGVMASRVCGECEAAEPAVPSERALA